MLNKDREEAFNRTKRSVVNHDWTFFFAFSIGEFEAKTLWLDEIELNRSKLMLTTNGIFSHEVDLWTIEGSFALLFEVIKAIIDSGLFDLVLCHFPKGFVAKVFIFI